MACKSCGLDWQREFNGEIALHFPGLKGLDKPIVWVFAPVLVCLNCGIAEFQVSEEGATQVLADGNEH